MEFLISIVKVVHLLVSMFLILVVLLQPGKSGDLGAVFGGGTSESVFGASGAVPFLVKLTRILAVLFVITSLSLGYYSVKSIGTSVIKDVDTTEQVIEEVQEEEVVDESGVFLNQRLKIFLV